jgi:hypothetical protein
VLPNERFSGGGHKRHVCRQCQKLGPAELAVRQSIRNLQRHLGMSGLVPRKTMHFFQQALQDPEARVREYARERIAETERAKGERAAAWADEERWIAELEELPDAKEGTAQLNADEDDLPF